MMRRPRLSTQRPPATYEIPAALAVLAFGLVVVTDAITPSSRPPIWMLGPLDELAHLATGLVVLAALGREVDGRLARGLVVTSVAIDLDHIPQYLGADWLTAGTARPYPHSLLTLAVVATILWTLRSSWPARNGLAMTVLGVLIGLSAHFLRDLAEPHSGMALLWPVSRHTFSIPRSLYLELLGGAVAWSASARLASRLRLAAGRRWARVGRARSLDSSTAR